MSQRTRPAFTLVEVLVAMAITLLIMATVVTVFSDISTGVADSKAGMEMSDQIQGVRDRLQSDLSGVTVSTKAWLRSESGSGYVEVIEGPRSDLVTVSGLPKDGVVNSTNATQLAIPAQSRVPPTALGDFDDVLMFTTNNPDHPFTGRGFQSNGNNVVSAMVQSNQAEVIWFAIEHPVANPGDANYLGEPVFRTIYRRALLIMPGVPIIASAHALNYRQFYEQYDVSVRRVGNKWVPNSLAGLSWRQNRFAHQNAFPHRVDLTRIRPYNSDVSLSSPLGPLGTSSAGSTLARGQDIMLRNVLAFDVRVYDPQAPLRVASDGTVVAPGDPGWSGGSTSTDPNAKGAFVDLNYLDTVSPSSFNAQVSWFAHRPRVFGSSMSLLSIINGERYANWDTWPFAYEQDGLDNDDGGSGPRDEGTNGLDDNNNGLVDDPTEFETAPPYIAPLRGVFVRIRGYEPFSRQIREVTVVENFAGK